MHATTERNENAEEVKLTLLGVLNTTTLPFPPSRVNQLSDRPDGVGVDMDRQIVLTVKLMLFDRGEERESE